MQFVHCLDMVTKSQNNILAAKRILDANDPSISFASIHCSYYAVFQYMKYLLANLTHGAIPYDKQDEICREKDSHKIILEEIRNQLPGRNLKKERNLIEAIRALKTFRKKADYTQTVFSVDDCLCIKQDAEAAISKLKSFFNNKIQRV